MKDFSSKGYTFFTILERKPLSKIMQKVYPFEENAKNSKNQTLFPRKRHFFYYFGALIRVKVQVLVLMFFTISAGVQVQALFFVTFFHKIFVLTAPNGSLARTSQETNPGTPAGTRKG